LQGKSQNINYFKTIQHVLYAAINTKNNINDWYLDMSKKENHSFENEKN